MIKVSYRQPAATIRGRPCCAVATGRNNEKGRPKAAFRDLTDTPNYSASLAAFFFGAAFFLGSSASSARLRLLGLLCSGLLRRLGLGGRLGLLVVGHQLFLADLLVGDRNLAEQVVDDLLLEQRRAQRGQRVRVAAVEFEGFLLLVRREAADRSNSARCNSSSRNGDAGLLADLGQHQAEAHAALGKPHIFGARLFFRRLLVGEGAAGGFEVAVDLAPDVVELGLDQLRRRLELVGSVELVEQLALDLLARHRAELALDLAAHDLAQALQRFQAEVLGRLVVDLECAGLGHFLDGDVEGGFLAGQMRRLVILREGHGDLLLVAGLGADQLVLEAGDEFLGAEHQRLVVAGAAVEGLAADLADIVDA